MKTPRILAATCLLALPLAAVAGVVTVSGSGQSHDYATAVADAQSDAAATCTGRGGVPLDEVYTHVTRANEWLATVIIECGVP